MLLNGKPAKATEIAKECKSDFKPVMGHLFGLLKTGYITIPTKGFYIITQKGKVALGIPETTKECAKELLSPTSNEKAFLFYAAVHKPLNVFACGLKEFAEKTRTVETTSLEFHLCRGDFEKWFTSLGDAELAKKMELLKAAEILGEPLRAKLVEIVENRCSALSTLTS
jgi:hypothetical protein